MNISDISVLVSVIAGLIAIPFAASTITISDDYIYGISAVLNSTPDIISNSSISGFSSKTVSDELIEYVYQTPQGKFAIRMFDGKFETALTNIGRKVSSVQSPDGQVWMLQLPSESLVINQTNQKISEVYKNLDGYMEVVRDSGTVFTTTRGTASESSLQEGMLRLENDLNYSIALIKNMTEEILGLTKVEISYVYCAGNTSVDYVSITNNKRGAVSLAGWTLSDSVGATTTYTFPSNFTISPETTASLYSNVTGISWNNNATETATLKDSLGNELSRRVCDVY